MALQKHSFPFVYTSAFGLLKAVMKTINNIIVTKFNSAMTATINRSVTIQITKVDSIV